MSTNDNDADEPAPLSPAELKDGLKNTAFAFRGYNITNLGETPKLLGHTVFGPIVRKHLQRAGDVCSEITKTNVDLVGRVQKEEETSLDTYPEALALVVAAEQAQLELLKTFFDISLADANMLYGFSLGEISGLVAAGVLRMEDALRIPLDMSKDCVDLAHDVTLGVLFSLSGELSRKGVHRLCLEINSEGQGVIGVSAYLSPNSMLLMGQGDTLDRFRARKSELSSERIFVRKNDHRWPPLHTPIVWQRNIPNRSQFLMHTMPGGCRAPKPPVLSMVTGDFSYDEVNARDIIGKWIDHPQLLWEAVDKTLSRGIETVVHVGPQPNIIPATFERLASNVLLQTKGRFRMRTLSRMVERRWLAAILPKRASLLRAAKLRHVTLENWLLQQKIG